MLMNHLYFEPNCWTAKGGVMFCKALAAPGITTLMPEIKKVRLSVELSLREARLPPLGGAT